MTVSELAENLPDIETLREFCRGLAMVEAIVYPNWENRYYLFDSNWATGEEMAEFNNGQGDQYLIMFSSVGAYICGFDHESPMSPFRQKDPKPWPGIIDTVPNEFQRFVEEPAFSYRDGPLVTVCLWRGKDDDEWRHGNIAFPRVEDPDGADHLFWLLHYREVDDYIGWAEEYYEKPIDAESVAALFRGRPLTKEIVETLNAEITLEELEKDIEKDRLQSSRIDGKKKISCFVPKTIPFGFIDISISLILHNPL
ncbi:hypothetical protein VHEMI00747 [[Torrubiella] hemipterigena]|uniref:Uncharacterized protein n=1 Tax=[Torrubiella] hemipterigena TaxID=1531966 RepID=A0A0A1SR81_9HYPO|nr:hypothetical protein VHEMI00747 [[Torrubiella] hemipterigena]